MIKYQEGGGVEIALLIFIILGICLLYLQSEFHRYERIKLKSRSHQSSDEPRSVVFPQQPSAEPLQLSLSKRQSFSDLRAILEELADRGWSKNRSSWNSNLSLNPSRFSSVIELDQVVKILLDHARKVTPEFDVPQMVPRTIVEPAPFAAGQFEVDEEGWVTIRVSPDFLNDRLAAQAILAHETCHYILEQAGIRQSDFHLNERYTDLCMFICGFGQVFLQGYRRKLSQDQLRPGHRLGYLTDAEYKFAHQYVIELHQLREASLRSELDELKKRMMQILHGDRGAYQRIMAAAVKRNPHQSEVDLHRTEIERLETGG